MSEAIQDTAHACNQPDEEMPLEAEDQGISSLKLRLSEIADLVEDPEISLDDMFELYEESLDLAKSVGDIISHNATHS